MTGFVGGPVWDVVSTTHAAFPVDPVKPASFGWLDWKTAWSGGWMRLSGHL